MIIVPEGLAARFRARLHLTRVENVNLFIPAGETKGAENEAIKRLTLEKEGYMQDADYLMLKQMMMDRLDAIKALLREGKMTKLDALRKTRSSVERLRALVHAAEEDKQGEKKEDADDTLRKKLLFLTALRRVSRLTRNVHFERRQLCARLQYPSYLKYQVAYSGAVILKVADDIMNAESGMKKTFTKSRQSAPIFSLVELEELVQLAPESTLDMYFLFANSPPCSCNSATLSLCGVCCKQGFTNVKEADFLNSPNAIVRRLERAVEIDERIEAAEREGRAPFYLDVIRRSNRRDEF